MKRRRAKITKALQGERDVLTTGERTILKKKERNMLMTDMAELLKKARTGGACGQMEKGAVTTTGQTDRTNDQRRISINKEILDLLPMTERL